MVFMNFIIAVVNQSYEKCMSTMNAQQFKVKVDMIVERESLWWVNMSSIELIGSPLSLFYAEKQMKEILLMTGKATWRKSYEQASQWVAPKGQITYW